MKSKEIDKSFLFCQSLKTTSQAEDAFHTIKDLFTKHQFSLDRIGSICTDEAPAMLGNRLGFATLLRKEISNLKFTHSFLYRHALVAKTLPPDSRKTLQISVKVVNSWPYSKSPTVSIVLWGSD